MSLKQQPQLGASQGPLRNTQPKRQGENSPESTGLYFPDNHQPQQIIWTGKNLFSFDGDTTMFVCLLISYDTNLAELYEDSLNHKCMLLNQNPAPGLDGIMASQSLSFPLSPVNIQQTLKNFSMSDLDG